MSTTRRWLDPGITPSREALAAEDQLDQKNKRGLEIDQGIFLNRVLAHPICGMHLCHAMLLPRPEAFARLDEFRANSKIELATATVERGRAAIVTLRNPRFLNAEDNTTIEAMEIAVDLAMHRSGNRHRSAAAARSIIRNITAAACSAPASI